ncbi:MAG: family 1 glycosylhydrolase, partial [Propionicimonas sp.]|nr:family 1 glycosylhydrolase [Propionicimonas sp.]
NRRYPSDILADFRAVEPAATAAFEIAVRPGDLDLIGAPIDVLGVNFYHGDLVSGHPQEQVPPSGHAPVNRPGHSPFPAGQDIHTVERGLPRTSMNWEVQPDRLTRLLERIWSEYAGPTATVLCVTENGAAHDDALAIEDGEARVHDPERVRFLEQHLSAVLEAIAHGVDVRGYFCWSLLDNFEWAWGYTKRFGLIRVDYDTQCRILKDSAHAYRRIITTRSTH